MRAEQVGSLLRPRDLLAARAAYAEGRLDIAVLRAKENESIRAAVARQRDIGIDVFADGEMRRYSWLTGMADAVDGFLADSVMLEWHGPGGGPEQTTAKIVGARLRKREMLTAREVPFPEDALAASFRDRSRSRYRRRRTSCRRGSSPASPIASTRIAPPCSPISSPSSATRSRGSSVRA